MLYQDPLHRVGDRTPYMKHNLQPFLSPRARHVLRESRLLLPISKAQLALQGFLMRLFASWESNMFCLPLKKRVQASLQANLPHSSSEKIICLGAWLSPSRAQYL